MDKRKIPDDEIDLGFTPVDMAQAANYESLGPEYFAARRFMDRFMAAWTDEHLKPLADAVTEAVTDQIREKVWDDFRDFLLMDTESNAQGAMRQMVEGSVKALLSGQEWALKRYPLASDYSTIEVRAKIAELIPDGIAKARIADLEKEVETLRLSLEWERR